MHRKVGDQMNFVRPLVSLSRGVRHYFHHRNRGGGSAQLWSAEDVRGDTRKGIAPQSMAVIRDGHQSSVERVGCAHLSHHTNTDKAAAIVLRSVVGLFLDL